MIEWFNSLINWGVSLIWGNGDWLIVGNPWYGLIVFLLVGVGNIAVENYW